MKNKTTAALLAFFIGGVGGQWVYLGKPWNFILSLMFFWTGIPTFIALYHFVVFLTMKDENFDAKYNSVS